MKEIKMSEIMLKDNLVFDYSKAEDLRIIVDEPVPEGAKIKIASPHGINLPEIKLIIEGDVGKKVKIRSPERKVDVIINGDIKEGASILLKKGNVIVKNVNRGVRICTYSGSIKANTVDKDKSIILEAESGCILSDNIKDGNLIITNGFITANTIGDAKLRSKCGKVYIKQGNSDVHNKDVTLPIDSAAKIYDELNANLRTIIDSACDNETINDAFNQINNELMKIDQPARNQVHRKMPGITVDIGDPLRVKFGDRTTTNYYNTPPHRPTTSSRRNGNAPRSSNFRPSSHTFYTNVPTQGFDWEYFNNAFSTNISNNIGQAAASGNITRLPNANNLQFGNTYHIDMNQISSPQRQTTASRGTGESANSNQRSAPQTQQAAAASSESRRGAPPAYDGESAATANVESPPAYSEKPRENEQTITETIHDPNVSQPHTQRTVRK